MNRFQNKSPKKILLSILAIFLTIFYSFFIHDLLAVSWQKFVDFFFYILLLTSSFIILQQFYQYHFRYLNLSDKKIKKMSYEEFVDLIAHLAIKMDYTSVTKIKDSIFDLSIEKGQKKYIVYCYHKKRLTTLPIIKNAHVILITDYVLAPYEFDKLNNTNWELVEKDKLYFLLNSYLV